MNKERLMLLIVLISFKGYSQLRGDLFSFNYTLAPVGNDDLEYYKTDFKVNLPIKLRKGILLNSVGLDYYQLRYTNATINTEDLDQFYKINYGLKYIYPINHKWSLAGQAGTSISSNLTGTLTSEDFNFRGSISAVKRGGTFEKPSRVMFGLNYSAILGKPRILPFLSYAKKVSDKFSYGIGFPNTYSEFTINNRSSFKGSVWLNGFYSNLSNPVNVSMTTAANKASFTAISLGLDYNYKMDEMWVLTFKVGYSLHNEYELLDDNDNAVYNFDLGTKPYFSMGVKINLKNKFKNKYKNDKQ